MIPYQLPTGKTIYITTEEFLNMTDEREQEYIANDAGYEITNPFYHSSIDSERDETPNDFLTIQVVEIEDLENLDLDEDLD